MKLTSYTIRSDTDRICVPDDTVDREFPDRGFAGSQYLKEVILPGLNSFVQTA